jgi:putative FmdB family regulatory protein
MPRYSYRCSSCNVIIEQVHSWKILLTDCSECGKKNTLVKDFSAPVNIKNRNANTVPSQVGEKVNQSIRDAKEEIKQQKKDLKKRVKK